MNGYIVLPSQIRGRVKVPASKSQSIRALLFAALAKGESLIEGVLDSPDIHATINACNKLGAHVQHEANQWKVRGVDGRPKTAEDVIQADNSGIVLRFIGAVAALAPGYTVITGDASIRSRRPLQPLIDGLQGLGAFAVSARGNSYAPLIVKGPLKSGSTMLDGTDSQPVSGLLIASAFTKGPTEICVENAGERPWVDLTLSWFDRLKIRYDRDGFDRYRVYGPHSYSGFQYQVPGDYSSAAFPLAAAAVTGGSVTLENLDPQEAQGDKKLVEILCQMGAQADEDPIARTVKLQPGTILKGIDIDVNDVIDALPILAVLGCYAQGTTRLYNGRIARRKECDRIRSICTELKKMGAHIEEQQDGCVIQGMAPLKGAKMHSCHDHRIAMALAVAALGAEGESSICDVQCVAKTYPQFHLDMRAIGANIQRQ